MARNNYYKVLTAVGLSFACLVMAVSFSIYAAPHIGWRVNGLRSGSMAPALNTGDMVVTAPVLPETLKVNDIVVFHTPNTMTNLICHRVLSIMEAPELTFQTKGDANKNPDPFLVPATDLVGKLAFHIPLLGYAVQFLQTKSGLIIFLVFPGVILTAWCLRRLKSEIAGMKNAV